LALYGLVFAAQVGLLGPKDGRHLTPQVENL